MCPKIFFYPSARITDVARKKYKGYNLVQENSPVSFLLTVAIGAEKISFPAGGYSLDYRQNTSKLNPFISHVRFSLFLWTSHLFSKTLRWNVRSIYLFYLRKWQSRINRILTPQIVTHILNILSGALGDKCSYEIRQYYIFLCFSFSLSLSSNYLFFFLSSSLALFFYHYIHMTNNFFFRF